MAALIQEEINASDIVLQMKATANRLYSSRDYFGAASIYSAILNQLTQDISPILIRVVQCNRAACLIELGRYQDAIPDLQEVIRAKAHSFDGRAVTQKAHFRLARCCCELGRYGDAMMEMERYRELIGGQPQLAETALYTKILGGIISREQAAGQGGAHSRPGLGGGAPHPPPAHYSHSRPAAADPTPASTKHAVHRLRYEIRVFNMPMPIVRYDAVPATLCTAQPPEVQTMRFLANLVKKHHSEVMALHPWPCWNCPARAVSLVHTPASYTHLSDPQVIDFAQPVCVNGGACEKAAREMMKKEMRIVAAQAKGAA